MSCASSQGSLTVFPESKTEKMVGEKKYVLLAKPELEARSSIISWPGEYDFSGMTIRGIGQEEGKQVSYVVVTEGLRCGFLSSPLQEWSEHEVELLGDLDVLVIPADDAKLVQHLVEEVDPPVVIPLPSKDAKTYQEVLKVCGAKEVAPVPEVKLKKGSLPADSRTVYVLETD